MIKPAINTFSAGSSREIDTKEGRLLFLEVVCLGVTSVNLLAKFGQGGCPIDVNVAIRQVFVIPYVVVIVALLVRCIFFRFFDLPPCRSLHPLMHLEVLEPVELLNLGSFVTVVT